MTSQNINQSSNPRTLSTEGEKLWVDENGILRSEVFPVYLTYEHALAAINGMKKLTSGVKSPILVDMRNAIGTSNEARKCYSGSEGGEIITACAMLIESPLSRIMGNFYLGINKTTFPFKLFTNEAKALEWLSRYI